MGLTLEDAESRLLKTTPFEASLSTTRKNPTPFSPRRVVILSKTTRYQYEINRAKRHAVNVDDEKILTKHLKKRSIDAAELKRKHDEQHKYVEALCSELQKDNIEVRVVTRTEYTPGLAQWADLIVSAGGDGTFLTAASKVRNSTPVIGINTDPIGSEGHLCLTGKSRRPANEVIRQFLSGDFTWTTRQRVRVTLAKHSPDGADSSSSAEEHVDQNCFAPTERPRDSSACKFSSEDEGSDSDEEVESRLALNEVFMGESHAARVSYYEVQVDDGPLMKQKSSGMTVCTGTGSTSWHYNINRLTENNLHDILQVMASMGFNFDHEVQDSLLEEICKRFNEKLVFEPEAQKMAFSIRDPVFNATFPKTASRGFAHRIRLKSRCTHAHLVLDGATTIPFNQGAEVILEVRTEDALKSAILL
jgi:NAD+ kinase